VSNGMLGVTVLMPTCTFAADVSRDTVSMAIVDLDNAFDERQVQVDDESRIAAAILDAMDIAEDMMAGHLHREEAVSDLVLNFLYAYSTQAGIHWLDKIRGVVAAIKDDRLVCHSYMDDATYDEASAAMRAVARARLGLDDDEDEPPPTIH